MTTALATCDRDLFGLADQINEAHRQVEQHARSAVLAAREAGRLLVEAKDKIGHGNWLHWLKSNCDVSERTAQRYMLIYQRWGELESKTTSVTDLSVNAALAFLAAKDEQEGDLETDSAAHEIVEEPEALESVSSEVLTDKVEHVVDVVPHLGEIAEEEQQPILPAAADECREVEQNVTSDAQADLRSSRTARRALMHDIASAISCAEQIKRTIENYGIDRADTKFIECMIELKDCIERALKQG
jgi:hypothetical protein